MAAPQIPNLRTLLGARGGGRGRARGRGGFAHGHAAADNNKETQDRIVQNTDQDALYSRLSAVELGYLEDDFIKYFATEETPRRFPIINRGTYTRTAAIDQLVDRFLSALPEQPKQIISLGAGSDTRYFRRMQKHKNTKLIYHELDFPANTAGKIAAIRRSPELMSLVTLNVPQDADIQISDTALLSPHYNIHPIDLRSFASPPSDSADAPTAALPHLPNLSRTTPTLLLSECCLIYLAPTDADRILHTLATQLLPAPTPVGLIIYEPIRPHDPFGKTMVANLAARGLVLQTLQKYASLSRQRRRLRVAGFASAQRAADTAFIWTRWVPEAEKERIAGLEMMDELEEWELLAQHYCIAWGWRDGEGDGDGGQRIFGEAWEDVQRQEGDDEDDDEI